MSIAPLDHAGLEVLDLDTCLGLVDSVPVGRLAWVQAGAPMVLPVNHARDGMSIVFRVAAGSKLDAASRCAVVAFEADEWDADLKEGWSVVMTGGIDIVDDDAEQERLDRFELHPWADGMDRPYWVRVRPDQVTGRRIAP